MKIIGESCQKVQIEYPTEWEYVLISEFSADMDSLIKDLELPMGYTLEVSKHNKKFISYKLKLVVKSEEQRVDIYNQLRGIKEIRYII